jgi:hypothetical protein
LQDVLGEESNPNPDCSLDTQITRIRNQDGSQTLKKHIDGTTLPYSGPNLTSLLSGVTDPIFVLQKIDANGNKYPFTS